MMGYSYNQDEGPKMCFNPAKSWQLGWYQDRAQIATIGSYKLIGLADYSEYDSSNPGDEHKVILKIEGGQKDYYIGFNRKIGINSGTVEGGDQVTVVERDSANGDIFAYRNSWLVAKLSAGGAT